MAVASYNYNPYSASSRATATSSNPYAQGATSPRFGTRQGAYRGFGQLTQGGMAYSPGRNPWGGSTSTGGSYAPPQTSAEGTSAPYNASRDTWSPSNADNPQYDLNAAKRMAYLQGNVGGKGNAEYDYLSALKGRNPAFQQSANPPGWSGTGQEIDPITRQVTHGLTKEQFAARQDPNYSSNRMNTLFQRLPQYQQFISQLGGMPGQPDNNERWKYFLERVMMGDDPQAVLSSGRFWGGN